MSEIAKALLAGYDQQLSETEAKFLAEAVDDLVGEYLSFRRGRRGNGTATVQLNVKDQRVRGHETSSRRVG